MNIHIHKHIDACFMAVFIYVFALREPPMRGFQPSKCATCSPPKPQQHVAQLGVGQMLIGLQMAQTR